MREGHPEQNSPGNRVCRYPNVSQKFYNRITCIFSHIYSINDCLFQLHFHRVLDWEQLMVQRTQQVLYLCRFFILSVLILQFFSSDGHPDTSNQQSMLWDEVVVCIVLGSHQIWEITIQPTVFLTVTKTSRDVIQLRLQISSQMWMFVCLFVSGLLC